MIIRPKHNCNCISSSLYLLFEVLILQREETELVESTFLYVPLHQHFCLEFFLGRFFLKVLTAVDILFQIPVSVVCVLGIRIIDESQVFH